MLGILLTAPSRKANPSLHRELLFFAIERLGQVYSECKKRWTAKAARALVLAQAEQLWAEWQHCCKLLLVFALPPRAQAAFRTADF